MRITGRGYVVTLALIFMIALGLRVGMAWMFVGLDAVPDYEANPDQVDYEFYASQMSAGKGYVEVTGEAGARRPPGTSFTLLPAYLVFGRSFAAGRLWFCLLSAVTCVVVGWLGKECFGALVGLTAAFWLALYPGHFYYTMHFVSETPYGLWLASAVGMTVVAVKKGLPWAHIVAGVLWGLALLTRPQIALVLPIALLAALWSPRATRRSHLAGWVIQVCLVVAVVSPWVARNALYLGKPTISTVGGHTFWGGNNETVLNHPELQGTWVKTSDLRSDEYPLFGTEVEMEATAWRYGFEFIQSHAQDMPYLCAMKLYRLLWPISNTPNRAVRWAFGIGWVCAAPFFMVGLWCAWRQSRGVGVVLMLPIAATVVVTVIFYGSDRFRDSCAPAFLVFSSLGLIKTLALAFPGLAETRGGRTLGGEDSADALAKAA